MSAFLLIVALAALVLVGIGTAILRTTPATSPTANLAAWFASLTGRRATGAALIAGGAILFAVILILRP